MAEAARAQKGGSSAAMQAMKHEQGINMKLKFYKPEQSVSGPAYSMWFKLLATVVCIALGGYATSIALRYPLLQYGFAVKLLLLGAALMLIVSFYWFLRSTITIDERGIT